jgi:hypothetical protein
LGGGAGSFAAIGGLGGIISGLVGLFGSHKKTPPPLTLFRLPDAQNETVYTSSHTANVVPQSGIYTSQHTDSTQYHSAQIAQAVKHALLNSSSLNDVISEI